jgi:hypothetical protein
MTFPTFRCNEGASAGASVGFSRPPRFKVGIYAAVDFSRSFTMGFFIEMGDVGLL